MFWSAVAWHRFRIYVGFSICVIKAVPGHRTPKFGCNELEKCGSLYILKLYG